jgi:dienelactone hydrolase
LVLDSFGPRKITDTATNQGQLSTWAELADAFATLKLLSADKRIDPKRIGIVGWSRGGFIAMNTALETARKASIADELKFAAHIVFYGPGTTQYRDKATDGSPFLFLHGEADNYVPIVPTGEFGDWLKTMGNAVTFISYPGVYHDFDVEGGFQGFTKTVEVSANCDNVIDVSDGHVVRMDHKPNPAPTLDAYNAYQKTCATHGANLQLNAKARLDAVDKVHAFLVAALRPNT